MKFQLIICLIAFTQFIFAQDKSVELIELTENGNIVLIAKNNSENDYKVEVKINLINAKTNVPSPVIATIPAGQEKKIAYISPENATQNWTYSIGYSYEKYFDQVNLITNDNTIMVYTMDGCGRCAYTIDFLKSNKIDYTEFNTTNNDANNIAMWQRLKNAGFDENSIRMPVIVAKGETLYNINNLPTVLEEKFLNK
ncbi:MAG: glutaredoxin domain-containing protein [Chitinophagales bacterium]